MNAIASRSLAGFTLPFYPVCGLMQHNFEFIDVLRTKIFDNFKGGYL